MLAWNLGNVSICALSTILISYALWRLLFVKNSRTYKYLCYLLLTSGLTIIQVILIDARMTEKYPVILLFCLPWQFLAPLCFSAFISSYLDRMRVFNRWLRVLLIPFVVFTIIYIAQKINALMDYTLFSEAISLKISNEWDENLAVLFALGNGIWNYMMIKDYERSLLDVPYKEVVRSTQWLRVMYTALIVLSLLWVLVIIYLKITIFERSMMAYYPLWLLYLGYYFVFAYLANDHLKTKEISIKVKKQTIESILTDFQIEGLNRIFKTTELRSMLGDTYDVTRILSYFATSLFDKAKEDEVLWDIVKNAIGKLDLEDCVIYMLDKDREVLVQKAAYGNKSMGTKKILSPMEIPLGKGIVGSVAASKRWDCIGDVTDDSRYLLDDMQRQSELAVPIMFENEVLGVLDSEHSEQFFFKEQHILIFQLVAKLTAVKLNRVHKKGTLTITNDNGYYKELTYLMEKEKMYRDPDLTLTIIAERLGISVTYLSQLVNTLSGVNFSDYINNYRVKQSQRLLVHPNYSSYPILAIGLEAGFNSKSTFYAAFKKHTGTTPSAYRVKAPFPS